MVLNILMKNFTFSLAIIFLFSSNLAFSKELEPSSLESKSVLFSSASLPQNLIPSQFSLEMESLFSLKEENNSSLSSSSDWLINIPFLEIGISYNLSETIFFKLKTDLSYKDEWNFYIEDMYFGHSKFKIGYFSYPVSYTSRNSDLFSKKTFVQQNLFPQGRRGLGILLKGDLKGDWKSFNWKVGLQSQRTPDPDLKESEKEDHDFILNASLFYGEPNHKAFASYFHKNSPESSFKSLGIGTDFSYEIKSSLTFSLWGEFWGISKVSIRRNSLSFLYLSFFKMETTCLLACFLGELKMMWKPVLKT